MTAPSITAVKREALRLFPAQPRVTTVSVGRPLLREGWLCTVRLPGGAELITFALTKQGALADAYDLLRGLQAVSR